MSITEVHTLSQGNSSRLTEGTYVRVIRDLSEIPSVRDIWVKWQTHPNADVDHYITVLSTLGNEASPRIFVLYRNDIPVAMLLGRCETRRFSVRLGYKELFPGTPRHLIFIYGGFMGENSLENCSLLIRAGYNCLRQGEAQVAFFSGINLDSPLFRAATKSQSFMFRDHLPQVQTHHGISVPESWDEFNRKLSSKMRKNLASQKRKLEQDFPGTVDIRCFQQRHELDEMFAAVEEVAKTTYQRGLGVGFSDTLLTRRRLSLQAESGLLKAYVLYLQGTPSAFLVGTLYQRTFFLDYMGYNAGVRNYSTGTYLLRSVIQNFCDDTEHSVDTIDFGLGDAEYKSKFSDLKFQEASVCLFAPTLQGAGINLFRTVAAALDGGTKKILTRTHLLPRIKKTLEKSSDETGKSRARRVTRWRKPTGTG